jgi:pyruvate formate lyase activating enzyme
VIDTAGYGFGEYSEILEYTDMVLFDMKHIDPENYMLLTGRTGSTSLRFLEAVQKAGVKMWIRHVVVPGITDGEDHIRRLADKLKPIKGVIKVELLPYHTLGQNKYEEMHIKYKLDGVEPMDKERCNYLTEILFEELGEDYYLESNK